MFELITQRGGPVHQKCVQNTATDSGMWGREMLVKCKPLHKGFQVLSNIFILHICQTVKVPSFVLHVMALGTKH